MATQSTERGAEVLTVSEVSKVLRIGRNAAYEAVRRGEIPSVRIGRRILVPRAALERFLAAGRTAAQSEAQEQEGPEGIKGGDPPRTLGV